MTFDQVVKSPWTPLSGGFYPPWMAAEDTSDDPARKGLGLRLKAARETRGMTQQQVADQFAVKKGTVSAWETGGGIPDALRLRRLARLYQVSADALLWDDAPSLEAMQFAAAFDAMTESQRSTLRTIMMAFVNEAASDKRVEDAFGAAPHVDSGRRTHDEPITFPDRRKH